MGGDGGGTNTDGSKQDDEVDPLRDFFVECTQCYGRIGSRNSIVQGVSRTRKCRPAEILLAKRHFGIQPVTYGKCVRTEPNMG